MRYSYDDLQREYQKEKGALLAFTREKDADSANLTLKRMRDLRYEMKLMEEQAVDRLRKDENWEARHESSN